MGRRNKGKERRSSESNAGVQGAEEAEIFHNRADRRHGQEAAHAYEIAVALYKKALCTDGGLSEEQRANLHACLGEALQGQADAVVAAAQESPEHQLQAAEVAADAVGCRLLREAVDCLLKARGPDGKVRVDALVNCGNALGALAELERPAAQLQILQQAAEAYKTALKREEDALTYSNLADTLISAAERLHDTGDKQRSKQAYDEALASYAKACSMASSADGDDVPGLLHNWATGLHSAGANFRDVAAVQESVSKLQTAIDFRRADVGTLNALGDALQALAELSDPHAKRVYLHAAVQEGYGAALQVDRNDANATIGTAEVELQLGRLEEEAAGAQVHFKRSANAYKAALAARKPVGTFRERCDIRYNFACASCLSGDLEASEITLSRLVELRGVTGHDILQDPDLQTLKGSELFRQLPLLVLEKLTL